MYLWHTSDAVYVGTRLFLIGTASVFLSKFLVLLSLTTSSVSLLCFRSRSNSWGNFYTARP
ncbi:hypothetical protein BDP27DRAFT_1443016 [Rhodocollybia butyracea]|uniref:Uncharacterized protein n=1 Tax=Rhodocollybia butyracea TaxID=206335 RepID=A0A9P5Q7N9_9AGAR|nr:hypothetical protein BDP27DRAFT_1443016 [Rhodocollybia butyracea]